MIFRRTATIVASLAIAITTADAQGTQASKDPAELQSYKLTMDTVAHVMQATHARSDYGRQHPESKSQPDSADAKTIDGMSERLASVPGVTGILAMYSLTPCTYSVAMTCFFEIGIAMAAINGGAKASEVVAQLHINPANIELLRTHKTELEELGRKYGIQGSTK